MKIQVILGRPLSGKTQRIIDELNSVSGKSVLLSLENPKDLMIQRGLNEKIMIIDSDDITQEEMETCCNQNAIEVIGIDYIEIMPLHLDLQALLNSLKETSVKRILITSVLTRNDQMTDHLKRRIGLLQPEYTRI